MRPTTAIGPGAAAAAALLLQLAPPLPVATTLRHPVLAMGGGGLEPVGVAGAAAVCWLLLAWLGLAMVLTAAADLPGRSGRLADRIAGRTVPRAIRQLLAVGIGAAVVTGSAGVAMAAPTTAHAVSATARVAPDLDWPARAAAPPASASVARPATPAAPVVVRTGDSLWSIARDHLPAGASNADISAAWPRWYAANRSVVGPAPDLLEPGQHLIVPTELHGGTS